MKAKEWLIVADMVPKCMPVQCISSDTCTLHTIFWIRVMVYGKDLAANQVYVINSNYEHLFINFDVDITQQKN